MFSFTFCLAFKLTLSRHLLSKCFPLLVNKSFTFIYAYDPGAVLSTVLELPSTALKKRGLKFGKIFAEIEPVAMLGS
jgi:hypothetical protein